MNHARRLLLFVADEIDAMIYRVTGRRIAPLSDWVDRQILGI